MKSKADPCPTCTVLRQAEDRAVEENKQSEATDCRVLRQQHPHHDGPSSRKTLARLTTEFATEPGPPGNQEPAPSDTASSGPLREPIDAVNV